MTPSQKKPGELCSLSATLVFLQKACLHDQQAIMDKDTATGSRAMEMIEEEWTKCRV